jgi:hypothetical protein
MEADISIWRKPGHFYFALTDRNRNLTGTHCPLLRFFGQSPTVFDVCSGCCHIPVDWLSQHTTYERHAIPRAVGQAASVQR